MTSKVETSRAPGPDPLLSEFRLTLRRTHYPLGFPLELVTNSGDVLAAAQDSWGRFRQVYSEPPVQLQIGVLESNEADRDPVHVVRSRRHLLSVVAGTGDVASCDLRQGFGFAWVAPATARNPAYLRYYYLEAMAYSMLQSLHLTPIHAACVSLNGRGVLLCGDSKAGKSSLAYACARKGWTYISDDASYLVRSSEEVVVIGNPYLIRLRESAPDLFPELQYHPVTLRAQGDRTIEIATAKQANLITAPRSSIEYIIFLKRQSSGPPILDPFPKEQALDWFESPICFGASDVRAAQTASLHRLLSAEALQFRYSELDAAVAKLKSLVDRCALSSRAHELSTGRSNNA